MARERPNMKKALILFALELVLGNVALCAFVLVDRAFVFSARTFQSLVDYVGTFSGIRALYYLLPYVLVYTFLKKHFHTRWDHLALFCAVTYLSSLLTPFTIYTRHELLCESRI